MKKKYWKLTGLGVMALAAFLAPAYSLFDYVIVKHNKKGKKSTSGTGKKRLELRQIKMNHPRSNGFEDLYEAGKAWCMEQEMKDCHITSKDGLNLHALYFPAERPKRSVLLSHGYRGSSFGDFANVAQFLHEQGCNLLFIDQRCCGQSEGKYITFGAKEQYDVLQWSKYLNDLGDGKLPIYLYGVSLGASSVLMASAHELPKQVRGLIADCGYCSMKAQMKYMASHWFHLHWIGLLLLRMDILCQKVAGFRMADADTAAAMERNRRPILFFHGSKDTFVDPKNTMIHFSECRAPKDLVLIPGARHICSSYVNPKLYRGKILSFFSKHD